MNHILIVADENPTTLEAIRLGARNYFEKPLNPGDIKIAITREIKKTALRRNILIKQLQHVFLEKNSDEFSNLMPKINTSLMMIIGNAEIAQLKIDNPNPKELTRHIHTIIERSKIIIDEINRHTMNSETCGFEETTR